MNRNLEGLIKERYGTLYSQEAFAFEDGYRTAEKGGARDPYPITVSQSPDPFFRPVTDYINILEWLAGYDYYVQSSAK